MDIDWSTIVGSVVYTVQVQKLPENVPATDVVLEIDPSLTAFKLNEANKYQILVNECLVYVTYYGVVVKITNDTSCRPGTLSLTTILATPVYNMPSTDLTATPNEDPFQLFTDAFTILILNDVVFGGCGAFSCTSKCLNNEAQDFVVATDNKLMIARKSTLILGFKYILKVTCFDDIKHTFITSAHSLVVNITFNPETTSPYRTTLKTITSRSVEARTHGQITPTTTSEQTSKPDLTTATKYTKTPIQTSTSIPTISTTFIKTPGQTTSALAVSATYNRSSTSSSQSTSIATSVSSVAARQIGKTKTLPTSSSATETKLTLGAITGGSTAFSSGNKRFFSKPENIVTVVLPALAFGSAVVLGLGYIMRKKLKRSTVDTVLVE